MSLINPYRPIACGLHDRLLDWATRRMRVEIRYRDASGSNASLRDVIVDVWTEDGAEYLRTAGESVIRLDALLQVEDIPFNSRRRSAARRCLPWAGQM